MKRLHSNENTDKAGVIRSTVLWFLPSCILIISLFTLLYFREKENALHTQILNQIQDLEHSQHLVINTLRATFRDLRFLAEMSESSFNTQGPSKLKDAMNTGLTAVYEALSDSRPNYAQVRLLNDEGDEVIRVNRVGNEIVTVDASRLQKKEDRYYFQAIEKLSPGEYYISPIDLNVERNRIEKPFNPMVRMGTALYSKEGKFNGAVVINFHAQEILNIFQEHHDGLDGTRLLLTENGYYLMGFNKEENWGHIIPSRSEFNFMNQYPDVWEEIQASTTASFQNQKGLWIFSRFSMISESEEDALFRLVVGTSDYIGVVYVPKTQLSHVMPSSELYALTAVFIMMLFLVGTYLLARSYALAQNMKESMADQLTFNETLLDTVPYPVFVKDANNNYLLFNQACQAIFERSKDLYRGSTSKDLKELNKEVAETIHSADEELLQKGGEHETNYEIKLASGDYRHFLRRTRTFDRGDSIGGLIGVLADISQQEIQKQEYKKASEDALEIAREKSSFLANMSHEIRTPLNAVIGMCQLILHTDLSPKQSQYIDRIYTSSKLLLRVINDILDFSKLEAGKLETEITAFDLEEVLNNLATVLAVKCNKKDLELVFKVASSIPNKLQGDPHRLSQVLLNLMDNAVKFTEKGSVKLEIETDGVWEDKTIIRFSVVDTGIGMSSEEVEKLFEPFTQADSSVSRKYGGTGLGLNICRRLIQLMGGSLRVESARKLGSRFFFSLPFAVENKSGFMGNLHVESLRKMRILVVDDNEDTLTIISDMLRQMSFKPQTAKSGYQALDMLIKAHKKAEDFNLILLDYKMPGISGEETARRIFKNASLYDKPSILMMTAFGHQESVEVAKELGLDGVLNKPLNRSSLLNAIVQVFSDSKKEVVSPVHHYKVDPSKYQLAWKTVLLVEDNEINQAVARELLDLAGINVKIANDGKEAIEFLKTKSVDLVLMDIQMPVMDGITATKEIRKRLSKEELPIIAMTAHGMQSDIEKSISAGMNDHITKPVDAAVLYETIQKFLEPVGTSAVAHRHKPDDEQPEVIEFESTEGSFKIPKRLPGIDLEKGIERVSGNSRLYCKLLLDFCSKEKVKIESLLGNLDDEKEEGTFSFVHELKGAAGNLGMQDLYELLSETQTDWKRNGLEAAIIRKQAIQESVKMVLDSISERRDLLLKVSGKEGDPDYGECTDLKLLINQSLQRIREHDPLAINSLTILGQQLGEDHFESLHQTQSYLEQYDYDSAEELLNNLKNKLH